MKYAVSIEVRGGGYVFTEVSAADPMSAASLAHDETKVCGDFTVYPAYGDDANVAVGSYSL